MPFLPFVLLIAWQAISRSASFALGWATAVYFGQVPGRQGHVLSVASLVAVGWVIVVIGFALPLVVGATAESIGVVERNFSVEPIHALGLALAVVAAPPAIAAATTWAGVSGDRSLVVWLRLIPRSYPATASLGLAVLEMVIFTPILVIQRLLRERVLLQLPFVARDRGAQEEARGLIHQALERGEFGETRTEASQGPKSWPLRTVSYAARHLLGTAVRGEPVRILAGDLEVHAHASTVGIMGPKEDAYRARAALERALALGPGHLTWSEDAQALESELSAVHRRIRAEDADADRALALLDDIQARIDEASLTSDEWTILHRLRLQVEAELLRRSVERDTRAASRAPKPTASAAISGRTR